MRHYFPSSGRTVRGLFTVAVLFFILVVFGSSANAQTCAASATTPTVRAEGYAEQIGDVTFSCTGGNAGSRVAMVLFVGLSVTVTNRVDSAGNPSGIVITSTPNVFGGTASFYSSYTVAVSSLMYTVPASPLTATTITISGIRAAAASVANGTSGIPLISANVLATGVNFTPPSTGTLTVATLAPTLLSSSINNGVPCQGSSLPPSIDFPTFLAANTSFSAIRVTEASAAAFAPKTATSDTGTRVLVKLSGYPTGSRVFVPDAIVGNDPGNYPTAVGLYGQTPFAGSYIPGMNQLLLLRVNGSDANGSGGTFALNVPVAPYNFSTVSELTLSGGATYAVYEVVDGNPATVESAQIPVWVVAPASTAPACSTGTVAAIPTFTASLAPVSTVSTATATDPIPRFMATVAANDCMAVGDCSAPYYPNLSVNTTPLVFAAPSLGTSQQQTFGISNSGGGVLNYTIALTYGAGSSGWLTVTPTIGQNTTTVTVTASPATLAQGTYTATIAVTAGSQTLQVPVTFNVGPVGTTIQNVGNAASFQYGTVAPGSYAVIFGTNLAGKSTTTVTFNGVAATLVYTSATQINVIVPANLTNTVASVVVTADGAASNSFRVNLANAPGIFANGILNFADGQTNTAADPVTRGNFVIVYLTGLVMPLSGPVTVNIGSLTGLMPSYAGAQGTYPSESQVNITVPASLPASPNPVPLSVCVTVPGTAQPVCSNPVNVYIQ